MTRSPNLDSFRSVTISTPGDRRVIQDGNSIFNFKPKSGRPIDFIRSFRRINFQHETIEISRPMDWAFSVLLLLKANADRLVEANRPSWLKGTNHN